MGNGAEVFVPAGSGGRRLRGRVDAGLGAIREKVSAGERLTLDEGETLYATPDIWSVLEMGDGVRRRLHGDVAYYNINRHLNYSNVCALSCKFCEFYRKKGEGGAYTRDMGYIREQAIEAVENGATEIHSVGGLHPHLPFEYYTDLVRTIREAADEFGSTGFQPETGSTSFQPVRELNPENNGPAGSAGDAGRGGFGTGGKRGR